MGGYFFESVTRRLILDDIESRKFIFLSKNEATVVACRYVLYPFRQPLQKGDDEKWLYILLRGLLRCSF